jgi:hypothetical protein
VKRHRGCSISGSFGAVEIPLPLSSFYLFDDAELGQKRWSQRRAAGAGPKSEMFMCRSLRLDDEP